MAIAGRGSKLERLPPDLRRALEEWMLSKQYTITEITGMINAELAERDDTDVDSVSRSAVGREAEKFAKLTEDMRRSQDYAQAMSDKFDLTSLGEQGQLLTFMLQQAMFKTASHAMDSDDPVDPETLGELVLTLQRLQRTNLISTDLEQKIRESERKKALAEAADKAEESAKAAGLTQAGAEAIKRQILGMA